MNDDLEYGINDEDGLVKRYSSSTWWVIDCVQILWTNWNFNVLYNIYNIYTNDPFFRNFEVEEFVEFESF